jgi:flagellar hook protein FlgE
LIFMMRSLFSGVAGLKSHQTRMDVIGNNIANVNTVGFKSGRVTFEDTLSQTQSGAAAATGDLGATNPKQIGLGVGIASIDTIVTDGSVQSTGKNTDLCLSGSGYFVVADGSEDYYTRNGDFNFDPNGTFISTGSGTKVQGWTADSSGTISTSGATGDIVVKAGQTMAAKATTSVTFSKNLDADTAVGGTVSTTITAYDSLGVKYSIPVTMTRKTSASGVAGTWAATVAGTITGSDGTKLTTPASGTTIFTANFNSSGSITGTSTATLSFTPTNGASAVSATVDYSDLTQVSGSSTLTTDYTGYSAGTMSSVSLNAQGGIVGTFSNGEKRTLAQVAIGVFNNPAGLTKSGGSLYSSSTSSGTVQITSAGNGGAGTLTPSSLEMSNVDLSEQFSDMIVTQRGFQSNSKIITVADEMIETLVNMKR